MTTATQTLASEILLAIELVCRDLCQKHGIKIDRHTFKSVITDETNKALSETLQDLKDSQALGFAITPEQIFSINTTLGGIRTACRLAYSVGHYDAWSTLAGMLAAEQDANKTPELAAQDRAAEYLAGA